MQPMLGRLLVPLLLLALLLGAAAARADTTAAPAPAALEEAEVETEEEGEEATAAEECEEGEEEFAAGEIDKEELEEACERKKQRSASGTQAEECILRSAHAHAELDAKAEKLKLTIGYTAYEQTSATIDVRNGADRIASLHRQLGHSGVIRSVESLRRGLDPKRLVLEFRIPSAKSAGCPSRRLVLSPR